MQKIYIGKSLLGDALFAEPALRAYSQLHGKPVPLILKGRARQLYEGNPYVDLLPEKSRLDNTCVKIAAGVAFKSASTSGSTIIAGFFPQLGLDPALYDLKPKLYFTIPPRSLDLDSDYLCIAPFSASCSVHTSGVANKTIALSWWIDLVNFINYPVVSCGNGKEPKVLGTLNLRGQPLKEVASVLKHSALVIAGDTGITAIAAALDCNIVLLNAALPRAMIFPQSAGKIAIIQSHTPPSWAVHEVLKAAQSILSTCYQYHQKQLYSQDAYAV